SRKTPCQGCGAARAVRHPRRANGGRSTPRLPGHVLRGEERPSCRRYLIDTQLGATCRACNFFEVALLTIVSRMAGLLGILLLLGGAGGVGAQQIDGLQQLEARLNADADNLEAGNSYRKAVIAAGAYDRALDTFKTVVAQHPRSANAYLNYGFAYVDKIPAAGSITQVILANSALTQFTKSIELQPTWIAYYTRGASYLFWPKIFGRASLGVAD